MFTNVYFYMPLLGGLIIIICLIVCSLVQLIQIRQIQKELEADVASLFNHIDRLDKCVGKLDKTFSRRTRDLTNHRAALNEGGAFRDYIAAA